MTLFLNFILGIFPFCCQYMTCCKKAYILNRAPLSPELHLALYNIISIISGCVLYTTIHRSDKILIITRIIHTADLISCPHASIMRCDSILSKRGLWCFVRAKRGLLTFCIHSHIAGVNLTPAVINWVQQRIMQIFIHWVRWSVLLWGRARDT